MSAGKTPSILITYVFLIDYILIIFSGDPGGEPVPAALCICTTFAAKRK
jgi:hypothetical protein